MADVRRSLSLIIHGDSKAGKSTLAATAPAPRLILDAEGGTRFLPQTQVRWDPRQGPPPRYDGTWETCVVVVQDFYSVDLAYQWLVKGDHDFVSVIIDSISEVQQRCVDAIAGTDQMTQPMWGELLRTVALKCRQFRDLCEHPTKPLTAVVLVAMTRERNGKYRPWVQGALEVAMPYYFDVCGFLDVRMDESGNPRRLLICGPSAMHEAGERVQGRIGPYEWDPTIPTMLDKIFGPVPA
jgi:hypothetical protein